MRTGIHRKVDDLGRVVIPAGIRRSLGIREGDSLEVHVEGEQVVLSKPIDQCVFCGSEDHLEAFREKMLCRGCVGGVATLGGARRPGGPPAAGWPADQPSRPTRDPATSEAGPLSVVRDEDRQDPPASTTAW